MDELISSLERLTVELVNQLPTAEFEVIVQFIEMREKLISLILANVIDEDSKKKYNPAIQRILVHDPQIRERMNELKEVERAGMSRTSTARIQKNSYGAAYTADSIYFDKKK